MKIDQQIPTMGIERERELTTRVNSNVGCHNDGTEPSASHHNAIGEIEQEGTMGVS
jgi:hypothetical protein